MDQARSQAQLVVFAGVPGVGKTTVARMVAARLGATFLRIDTIEAAIQSTLMPFVGNPVGYVVAARVAVDQLRAGRTVVADAVNGVEAARQGWIDVAQECSVALAFIEVTCSDREEPGGWRPARRRCQATEYRRGTTCRAASGSRSRKTA